MSTLNTLLQVVNLLSEVPEEPSSQIDAMLEERLADASSCHIETLQRDVVEPKINS